MQISEWNQYAKSWSIYLSIAFAFAFASVAHAVIIAVVLVLRNGILAREWWNEQNEILFI